MKWEFKPVTSQIVTDLDSLLTVYSAVKVRLTFNSCITLNPYHHFKFLLIVFEVLGKRFSRVIFLCVAENFYHFNI